MAIPPLLFSPYESDDGHYAHLKLAGDTIGKTVFNGQSTYYVDLENGAFFNPGTPTLLDGLNATYDGFSPASTGGVLTDAELDHLQAFIHDYNDVPTLGLFFTGFVPDDNTLLQNEIYERIAGFLIGPHGFKVTLRGLPLTSGAQTTQQTSIENTIQMLANVQPAAGGDDSKAAKTASQLEPSAGNGQTTKSAGCWNDAVSGAAAGVATSFSFGDSVETTLSNVSSCSKT